MNEKNSVEFLEGLIEDLKKIEADQHATIECLAKIQGNLQDEGKDNIAEKIGEVFGNATKNTELLHELVDTFQMRLNKLKAGN